jgi:hypothetical protein
MAKAATSSPRKIFGKTSFFSVYFLVSLVTFLASTNAEVAWSAAVVRLCPWSADLQG